MNRIISPVCRALRDPDAPILMGGETEVDTGTGLAIPPAGYIELNANDCDDSFAKGMDSAMREHAAQELETTQTKAPRYMVSRICVGLILLMWVIAGFSKVLDISAFVSVVEKHAVLPDQYEPLLFWVGPAELVMGLLLVFVMGSELRKFFGRFVLFISMGAIIGFVYYLSMVDPAVLQKSGCGCLSDNRIASGMDLNVRITRYIMNGALVLLHAVALLGPSITDSRRKSKQTAD